MKTIGSLSFWNLILALFYFILFQFIKQEPVILWFKVSKNKPGPEVIHKIKYPHNSGTNHLPTGLHSSSSSSSSHQVPYLSAYIHTNNLHLC
jgi:hypothetical protein